ncbi:hypothetical protein GJ496_001640 [Pomphorhynchus laevis]|nr:hypothetical protein GJ496_001640 [Pomphorhynchus laevis]
MYPGGPPLPPPTNPDMNFPSYSSVQSNIPPFDPMAQSLYPSLPSNPYQSQNQLFHSNEGQPRFEPYYNNQQQYGFSDNVSNSNVDMGAGLPQHINNSTNPLGFQSFSNMNPYNQMPRPMNLEKNANFNQDYQSRETDKNDTQQQNKDDKITGRIQKLMDLTKSSLLSTNKDQNSNDSQQLFSDVPTSYPQSQVAGNYPNAYPIQNTANRPFNNSNLPYMGSTQVSGNYPNAYPLQNTANIPFDNYNQPYMGNTPQQLNYSNYPVARNIQPDYPAQTATTSNLQDEGYFTSKLAQLYTLFKNMDTTGVISEKDIIRMLKERNVGPLSSVIGHQIFKKLDKDLDGKITWKDFLALLKDSEKWVRTSVGNKNQQMNVNRNT